MLFSTKFVICTYFKRIAEEKDLNSCKISNKNVRGT